MDNKSDSLDIIKDVIKFPLRVNELIARGVHDIFKLIPIKEGSKEAISTIIHGGATLILPFPVIGWLHEKVPSLVDWIFGVNGERSFLIFLGALGATAHAYVKVYKRDKTEWSPYGNARFSTPKELKQMNLFDTDTGIVFGKTKNVYGQEKLLVKPDTKDGHILVLGGSGSGKTKSLAIPTLLRWKGSAVVMNIKGDLAIATKDFKKAQQKVFEFNPYDSSNSCIYNPLEFMYDNEDALEMARVIIPDLSGDNAYFSSTAQDILAGSLLHGKAYGLDLHDISVKIRMTPAKQLIEELMNSRVPKVPELASSGFEVPEKQLGIIMSELRKNIMLFAVSDNVANVTSGRSDFSPSLLEDNITVYLSIPESKMGTYGKLFGVIYAQIIKHMLDRPDGKHPPILLQMDEFAQLGKLTDFQNRIATLRSRNIHIMTFIQSFGQLDEIYGMNARRVIIDNHSYEMILGIKDVETARFYTTRAGMKEAPTNHKSTSTNAEGNQTVSESEGHMSTPLVRIEEWQKLKDEPILFPFQGNPTKVSKTWVVVKPNPEESYMDSLIYQAMKKDLEELRRNGPEIQESILEPQPNQVIPNEEQQPIRRIK